MGSRSKKNISMVVQDNNLRENNTLVETWLANFHPEDQDNDHNSNLESSRFLINNISSTCDTKIELSVTKLNDRSTICGNDVDTVLIPEVNADAILPNTVIENVTTKDIDNVVITTDSERLNLSDDGEIVSSNVVIIDIMPENTSAKNMLRQDTISNAIEIIYEDFSVSDGSEYEPPQKKRQKKVFQPIRRQSSSSSDSSSSNTDSSSSSSGSSSSSSSSFGNRSKHSKSSTSTTSRSKRVSNLSIVHHNAASENIQPNTEQASIVTKSKKGPKTQVNGKKTREST
ncbi:hypothetical protein HF086_008816 [Spodoptera exigua]|uniref:Uncharacterized protein n=1 Tax=Spodoptera exigua TaxID=7107 RepID=A0A922SMD4_SPOEX|nr:hypothetical protein HF086_008816 [Spodoptera exigua]